MSESKSKPLVSITILSWNRKECLKETLSQLTKQEYPNLEIIVVDNASKDGSDEMVEQEFPKVRLIRMPSNVGILGRNVAFANAKGKYIVVLDNDSWPESNAVEKMVEIFENEKKLGIVAFHIINPLTKVDITKDWVGKDPYVFWGCGAGIRKKVLAEVGFYDEGLFLYANEYDLSIRILNAGYRIIYTPEIRVYHLENPSGRYKERLIFRSRNEAWFNLKYFPYYFLLFLVFRNLCGFIFTSLKKKSILIMWYYFAGYLVGYLSFWIPLEKRQVVNSKVRKIYLDNYWAIMPVFPRLRKRIFKFLRKQ